MIPITFRPKYMCLDIRSCLFKLSSGLNQLISSVYDLQPICVCYISIILAVNGVVSMAQLFLLICVDFDVVTLSVYNLLFC